MNPSLLMLLVAMSSPGTSEDIAERVQGDVDAFVFCVLDNAIDQLPSASSSETIAEVAADRCHAELAALEASVARQYRKVNRDVWPAGRAEEKARENADEYRRRAMEAAVEVINEQRASS